MWLATQRLMLRRKERNYLKRWWLKAFQNLKKPKDWINKCFNFQARKIKLYARYLWVKLRNIKTKRRKNWRERHHPKDWQTYPRLLWGTVETATPGRRPLNGWRKIATFPESCTCLNHLGQNHIQMNTGQEGSRRCSPKETLGGCLMQKWNP